MAALKKRRAPSILVIVFACCCLPAAAFADEMNYLPDSSRVILSVDVTAAKKTKTSRVKVGPFEQPLLEGFLLPVLFGEEWVGRATVAVIARIGGERVVVLTATRAITPADVKTAYLAAGTEKLREIKHGPATIYQQLKKSDTEWVDIAEHAWFVAEGKYVVVGKAATLKKIIDRGKPVSLSPAMLEGVKAAPFSNVVSLVVDLEPLRAAGKFGPGPNLKEIIDTFQSSPHHAGMVANMDKLQVLALKANEPAGKGHVAGILICKDSVSAVAVKTVLEKFAAEVEGQTGKMIDAAARDGERERKKFLENTAMAMRSLKLTNSGNQVVLTLEEEPERVVDTCFIGLEFVLSRWPGRP